MSGGHTHGHGHGEETSRRLLVVLAITVVVFGVEVVGAVVSGSLALLADAGHMLTDVAGLAMALVAARLARRPATARRTWGYHRAEILAAAAQSAVLLAVGGWILVEAVRRLFEPPEVAGAAMVVFGVVGLVGNGVSILVLASSRAANLNLRAAFLDVLNDTLGSLGVLAAAAAVSWFGWERADPLVSLLIAGLILPRTWSLLRESVDVLMEATPKGLDLDVVRSHLLGVEHVHSVHDVHATQVATGLPVLTAHVVVDDSCFHDAHLPVLLDQLQGCVAGHFDVEHSTFQFEAAGHSEHEHPAHT